MVGLLRLMLTEEFRVHTSYSGRSAFLAFPLIITGFSLAIAVTSERLFTYTPFRDAILLLHASVFLYGLSVGAFGFLGRQYLERTNGTRNYVVAMPGILPMPWTLPGLAAHEHLPPFSTDAIAAVRPILAGMGIVVALVAAAVFLVPEQYEPRAVAAREELPRLVARLKRLKGYAPLLSKEFVDLQRSGTYAKMFFSFVTPLLFLSFTAWFVRYGLQVPVGFNTVFYAVMVGFFGVILYNWLNNVDATDYLATLPVSVPQVIRAKLISFLLLTTWVGVEI